MNSIDKTDLDRSGCSECQVFEADTDKNIESVIKADLLIIGAGMAGLAAAVFAANRGLSTVITGKRSSMNFATGLMDLAAVHPSGNEWENPWDALDMIRRDIPLHPYSRVSNEEIHEAFKEIAQFLSSSGLDYKMEDNRNVSVITSLGTSKKSFMIPESMWKGVTALKQRCPALIVDFSGMKIYSANQIVSTLSSSWPDLKAIKVDFPGMEMLEEVYPEHMARALDIDANRVRLAETVRTAAGNRYPECRYIGFPALLGMYRAGETLRRMEELLGMQVFEIPTPPVSVPGIRLHEALTSGLSSCGKVLYIPEMVDSLEITSEGDFRVTTAQSTDSQLHMDRLNRQVSVNGSDHCCSRSIIESKSAILATGRFLGRGLTAKRTGIYESLLGIPVTQPFSREEWHHKDLFCREGHPVNRAGIEVDDLMRPLVANCKLFAGKLHASGSILAHSDWTRMKCGSGVAIATSFASVKKVEKNIKSV